MSMRNQSRVLHTLFITFSLILVACTVIEGNWPPTSFAWQEGGYLWWKRLDRIYRWDLNEKQLEEYKAGSLDVDDFFMSDEGEFWAFGREIAFLDGDQWIKVEIEGRTLDMVQTSESITWAATSTGFYEWQPETKSWNPSVVSSSGRTLVESPNDGIWFGLANQGLMQLKDDGELIHWTTQDGLTDNEVWSLLISDDGSIWVGTRWNLHLWNGNGWDVKGDEISSLDADGLVIYNLLETRNGTIWGATTAGIVKLEGINWSDDQDKCGPTINSLIQDRDDNIWIGCDRGLYRWNDQDWFQYSPNKGIGDSTFSFITMDVDGILFAATRSGIYQYERGKDEWGVLLEF